MSGSTTDYTQNCISNDSLSFLELLQLGECIILTQRPIEQRKFAQLLPTQVILGIRNCDPFDDNRLYLIDCLLDILGIT
jgi:hypothetical protein